MEFHKIQDTDFHDILNLLDIAFPVSRTYFEKELKHIAQHPDIEGITYGLFSDGGEGFPLDPNRISHPDVLPIFRECPRLFRAETLIGTVTYGRCWEKANGWEGEGFIRFLAVAPAHRRKGHATWMINRCLSDLKQQKCQCVCVAVDSTDAVAIKLWESFGFRKYDEATETYENGHSQKDFYYERTLA